jgi:hypothetical protein
MIIDVEDIEIANDRDRKRLAFFVGLPPEASAKEIARACNAHQRARELRRAIPTMTEARALEIARAG